MNIAALLLSLVSVWIAIYGQTDLSSNIEARINNALVEIRSTDAKLHDLGIKLGYAYRESEKTCVDTEEGWEKFGAKGVKLARKHWNLVEFNLVQPEVKYIGKSSIGGCGK